MNAKVALLTCLLLLSFSLKWVTAEKIAPDFTLTDIDGVEFSLSDYRGKVVLLNFFATWCGCCVGELPLLKVVHEKFGEGLVIISISVDPGYDTVEKLQQFRSQHGIDWILARDTLGVNQIYGVQHLPTLVIVGQEGCVRFRHDAPWTGAYTLSDEIGYVISRVAVGDINADGKVDIADLYFPATSFGSHLGDERWNEKADLNNDGVIDIRDINMVAVRYGKEAIVFNFLLNPSIEIDENGDNLPDNWWKGQYGDVSAVYSWLATGHSGTHSVKVSITYNASTISSAHACWYESFQIQDPAFEIGRSCFFRFWYKSNIKCCAFVSFWDSNGQWIGGASGEYEPADAWTLCQWLEFTIPEGTYTITFGILISNSHASQEVNAYATADDFELIHG